MASVIPFQSIEERLLQIAEHQDKLIRSRAAKNEILTDLKEGSDITMALDQFRRVDRYERRALSRRNALIKDLEK